MLLKKKWIWLTARAVKWISNKNSPGLSIIMYCWTFSICKHALDSKKSQHQVILYSRLAPSLFVRSSNSQLWKAILKLFLPFLSHSWLSWKWLRWLAMEGSHRQLKKPLYEINTLFSCKSVLLMIGRRWEKKSRHCMRQHCRK